MGAFREEQQRQIRLEDKQLRRISQQDEAEPFFRHLLQGVLHSTLCIQSSTISTLILNFKGQQLKGSTVKLFAKIRVGSGL